MEGALASSTVVLEKRVPRILIGLAAALAPALGVNYAPKFLALLQLNISPPQSSAAYKALVSYQHAFPQQAASTTDSFILLMSLGGRSVLNASAPECNLRGHLVASRCPLAGPVERFSIAFASWVNETVPNWVNDSTLASYYNFHRRNYTLLQTALLSSPKHPTASNATILRVQVPHPKLKGFAFTQALVARVDELVRAENDAHAQRGTDPHQLAVAVAGMPAFLMAAQDGVKADIEKMDTISFPLALLIFILMLKYFWRRLKLLHSWC